MDGHLSPEKRRVPPVPLSRKLLQNRSSFLVSLGVLAAVQTAESASVPPALGASPRSLPVHATAETTMQPRHLGQVILANRVPDIMPGDGPAVVLPPCVPKGISVVDRDTWIIVGWSHEPD